MKLFSPSLIQNLEELIREKSGSVKEIEAVKLAQTEGFTEFLVFVKGSEKPHYHAEHDLTFIVVRGGGELYLDGKTEPMGEGDVAVIPRGKVHFYRNTSEISVLLAIFSPPYDGKDSVPVEL
ncbi:MAG: cupin domain-containing protein [Aquificae bacterium]|nr:cupin domain-containing protein [Aquificota bacterium]